MPADLADGLGSRELEVPDWAFAPDSWNVVFLRGLAQACLGGRTVWEVGVGTGLTQLFLSHWGVERSVFSDYDPPCVPLARRNLAAAGLLREQFIGLEGRWDLVDRVDQSHTAPAVDVVVACIPQLPSSGPAKHHYDPGRYPEATRHQIGLGLNEALLRRARRVLAPGGRVVLNLAGRPCLSRLLEMFEACGYLPRSLYHELVPQNAGPSLDAFVAAEAAGHGPFEFFCERPSGAHEPVGARDGAAHIAAGGRLLHHLYVIEGMAIA